MKKRVLTALLTVLLAALILLPLCASVSAYHTANAANSDEWLMDHFSAAPDAENEPVLHFTAQNFILFAVCVAAGILSLAKPELLWRMEHWLSVKDGEPTQFYLVASRIGGVLLIITGFAMFLLG